MDEFDAIARHVRAHLQNAYIFVVCCFYLTVTILYDFICSEEAAEDPGTRAMQASLETVSSISS